MNNIVINHAGIYYKLIPYKNMNNFLDFINYDSEFINHVLELIKKKIFNA
jgi:hypothetical protein